MCEKYDAEPEPYAIFITCVCGVENRIELTADNTLENEGGTMSVEAECTNSNCQREIFITLEIPKVEFYKP